MRGNEPENESELWYILMKREPSREARDLAKEWLATTGANPELSDSMTEFVCGDSPDSTELEGCPHLVVVDPGASEGEAIDLTGATLLGVLEEQGSDEGPFNLSISGELSKGPDGWRT